MAMNIAQSLQDGFDLYYPEGPSDLEYTRFYANLAVRALFYADGQGVLTDAVLAQLIRQSQAAEKQIAKKEAEEQDADD